MDPEEGNRKTQQKNGPGNAGMENLILATNKMLDVCSQTGSTIQFDFPVIAVIGCQSAGKSSVLENFVGRDFLPRGKDIVTRRPLVLQLINAQTEYGEFKHCKEKKFYNFNEIRKEIQTETDRGVKTSKGVSEEEIILSIYSPNVLNLTLIDLPGITKNPIGDQPMDIEQQIKKMILHYIRNENCLILAVTPANSDLANSDALQLAREVDKDGLRTIGVITKLDLMDEGTDAREVLENRLLPLRRGYIGIVNRSQKHIEDQKDIAAALKSERDFFLGHKYYRHMADRMGTSYLQRILNQQLTEHIRDKLPSLQDRLRKQMVSLEKEVEEFNELHSTNLEAAENPEGMTNIIHNVIKQLREDFERAIGNLGLKEIDTDKLTNGAKINIIFHTTFPGEVSEISLDEAQMRHDINFAVRNIAGTRISLFTPYMVFEALITSQIKRLKSPVLVCIESVVEELTSAVRCCTQHISNYPNLCELIENSIISFIHNNGPKYKKHILSLIEMELAYMNIKHEEFMNNLKDNQSNASSSNTKTNNPITDTVTEKPIVRVGLDNSDGSDDSDGSDKSDGSDNSDDVEIIVNDINQSKEASSSDFNPVEDEKPTKKKDEVDPAFDGEVNEIYEKIDSYLRIVKKTTRDMVPKAITLYIIKELQDYINHKLLIELLALPTDHYNNLFALSPVEAEKYKQKTSTFEACKEALEIIRDVSMGTVNGAVISTEQTQ